MPGIGKARIPMDTILQGSFSKFERMSIKALEVVTHTIPQRSINHYTAVRYYIRSLSLKYTIV